MNLLEKISNYAFLEQLFANNLVLTIFGMMIALLDLLFNSEADNGFFLIALPVIGCFYCLPQFLGCGLVSLSKKRNNSIILIFIFIASIFSVMSIYSFYSNNNRSIFFFANIICSIILVIILLLKLVFEKNNDSTTMYCKKCRNSLKQGATFCSNCGTKGELQNLQTSSK